MTKEAGQSKAEKLSKAEDLGKGEDLSNAETRSRTIRDLVSTPFKKAMLAVQITSYVLIVGSPFIGGAIGKVLGLKAARTGGVILGIFIAGEVLFYGSLAFLGKEVVLLLRDKMKSWFRRKGQPRAS